MEVGDRKNQDEIILLYINDSVGKTPDGASSRIFIEHLPSAWKLFDPVDREEDFPKKLITEAGPFSVIVIHRIVKLASGDLEELRSHLPRYSARISSADTVAAAPDL